MNETAGIAAQIRETETAIRRLEDAVARSPQRSTLVMSLQSLEKRKRDLLNDLIRAASRGDDPTPHCSEIEAQ